MTINIKFKTKYGKFEDNFTINCGHNIDAEVYTIIGNERKFTDADIQPSSLKVNGVNWKERYNVTHGKQWKEVVKELNKYIVEEEKRIARIRNK